MLIIIKVIKKLFKVLNSKISPAEIAGGIALGAFIGLMPFMTLHNVILFLLIFILQVNMGMAFVSIVVFGLFGMALDPISDKIGYMLLVNIDALKPFWTQLYNMPIVPFTKFYNTIVLGSLVISMVLYIPIFIFAKKFVVYYREHFLEKFKNSKLVKLFKLNPIYKIYSKYSDQV